MMEQARQKRATDIFKLKGKIYAFDSTTIPLCLSVFWWAKFRKKNGGVKTHVLHNLESQVPAFFHISTASVHDYRAMKEIPYESESYYVFDRGYNAFGNYFHFKIFLIFYLQFFPALDAPLVYPLYFFSPHQYHLKHEQTYKMLSEFWIYYTFLRFIV